MKRFCLVLLGLIMSLGLMAQENPVTWKYSVNPISANEAELVLEATVDGGYHLYSQFMEEGGPFPTVFYFPESEKFKLLGIAEESPETVKEEDEIFMTQVAFFKKDATFKQRIAINSSEDFTIAGTIDYQICNDEVCIPFNDVDFSFEVKGTGISAEETKAASDKLVAKIEDKVEDKKEDKAEDKAEVKVEDKAEATPTTETPTEKSENLLGFILLAVAAGLAAVFTPCVFPMIPMTVSFFIDSDSGSKGSGILKGAIFTGSITLLYTAIGAIVAVTKSAEFANVLSTHWIPNIIFFALFVMFAFSFFGAFEITLPSGLSNKLDAKADKGGYLSAFFMAAVLAIVSFSCTGPFVATLLVEAAMGESVMKPLAGMFFFGLAMGSPFFLLALFPSLLDKMPRSGGWLNSVKVVFAFILLAFGLKFLLTIDSVYAFGLFTREAYLAIWIVIFSLMGLYLMGKIKFSHDSEVKSIGIFRLMLIIATFSFVVYLIPGLFGAPLKMVSALIPPQTEQQFDLTKMTVVSATSGSTQELCGTPKYSDKLELPLGLKGYFDYDEGLACAKEQNKPVFLDFKGHSCANCKKMESEVWSDVRVQELLKKYIIVALYCDDRTELPENEWVTSVIDGKVKKTMGKRNADFEVTRFKTNTLPYYYVIDNEGGNLSNEGYGYDSDTDAFMKYLQDGLDAFYAK